MTINETRRYMMLVRVRDFGDAHREMFLHSESAQRQLSALNIAVAELKTLDVRKVSVARQARSRRQAARDALVAQLTAISKTARAIAHDDPAVRDGFEVNPRTSDQGLVTLARSLADKARTLEAAFVDHGMPESFLADLEAALSELERAAHQRATERRAHTAARASIRAALAAGTTAVQLLDAFVSNQLRSDPVGLEMWQRDRRVEPAVRRRRSAAGAASLASAMPAVSNPEAAPPLMGGPTTPRPQLEGPSSQPAERR